MKYIFQIFKEHKWLILLVYSYCAFADLVWLFFPYITGKMIDGLIVKEYTYVFYFIGFNFVFIAFGLLRRIYDTKVFTKIYNTTVVKFIKNQNGCSHSSVVARSAMAEGIVGFLENEIPHYIGALYSIFGSLIFIFNINIMTGIILSIFMIPVIFLTKYFYKKIQKSNIVEHSIMEEQVSRIESGNMDMIISFLSVRR